jgi:hypothetical protein
MHVDMRFFHVDMKLQVTCQHAAPFPDVLIGTPLKHAIPGACFIIAIFDASDVNAPAVRL